MPRQWTGTLDNRLASLDRIGRRCDGNTRACPHPAVEAFDLWPADRSGNKLPDSEMVRKKACARHRIQFDQNGRFVVAGRRLLNRMRNDSSPVEVAHARFKATEATDSGDPAWIGFIRTCNEIDPGLIARPDTVDDWWAGGSVEEYQDVRVLFREESVTIVAKTARGSHAIHAAGEQLNVTVRA